MKIRNFIQRGRALYAICHGNHGHLTGRRVVAIDLSQSDPEMDHDDLKGRLRCSVCGAIDRRTILLIPQTDRHMRQGRQR